jgi:cell division septum initiation protein DivIVA
MTNQTDNFPDLMSDDSFEVVMRGYSRRQVHDYMIRSRNQIRDLEERLARTIDQAEQSRLELAEARRKLTESPQNPDELGERLSQILKLAHEEAAANKEASQNDASKVRDQAAAEADRQVNAAREQAESIRTAAQEEAERRIHDATASAERLLSQAGAEAEEKVATASAEAEETLRDARAEADRRVTAARLEAERLVSDAQAVSTSTLTSAQRRATTLDEHTGRRVVYLTDTHTEVVRRLNEIGVVLGDLLQRESSAGPLIDEASVLPPAPSVDEGFNEEDFSGEGFNDEAFDEQEDAAEANPVQVGPAPEQASDEVRPEPVQPAHTLDGMPEEPARMRPVSHDHTPPFRA